VIRPIARLIATIAIAVGAAFLVYRFGYIPVKVNYVLGVLRASGTQTNELRDDAQRMQRARRDLAMAREMIAASPERLGGYVVAAENAVILGYRDEAIALYKASMAYDTRSRTLLRLGILYCEAGNIEEAERYLLQAYLFNPQLRFHVPPTCPDGRVEAAAIAHAKSLRKSSGGSLKGESTAR
jgi:tetratricopeptide (TPR) repeat protein